MIILPFTTADGANDGNRTYDAVTKHSAGAAVVIPPRANAAERHTPISPVTRPSYRGD